MRKRKSGKVIRAFCVILCHCALATCLSACGTYMSVTGDSTGGSATGTAASAYPN